MTDQFIQSPYAIARAPLISIRLPFIQSVSILHFSNRSCYVKLWAFFVVSSLISRLIKPTYFKLDLGSLKIKSILFSETEQFSIWKVYKFKFVLSIFTIVSAVDYFMLFLLLIRRSCLQFWFSNRFNILLSFIEIILQFENVNFLIFDFTGMTFNFFLMSDAFGSLRSSIKAYNFSSSENVFLLSRNIDSFLPHNIFLARVFLKWFIFSRFSVSHVWSI